MSRLLRIIALAILTGMARSAWAGELAVVSVQPGVNALAVPVGANIVIDFDQSVERSSVNAQSLWAFGRWSGTVAGAYTFSDADHTVTLNPAQPFFHGEQVMVILSHDLQAAGGAPLRSAGYSFQFWTAAMPAPLAFVQLDSMSTESFPTEGTRSYGGIASDMDNDGFADLTIVNEDTADLRVFLNSADGLGLYDDFLLPTFPVNDRASPSEPADFNHDGNTDICVCNIDTASVSILLGNGDGTYAPQQQITVGVGPRGIAVLDADGDGDVDIVNTNSGSNDMSVLLNNGGGVFGSPTFYQGGVSAEWALSAADMDSDGILDLVVGARSGLTIIVNKGQGNGTFTPLLPAQSAGGQVWMLVTGDLDGDGDADVAAANSGTNNGAILRNNGRGMLGAPATYAADPFPLAADLGDVDGDGDLDWVTSSFGGDWWLFRNNGSAAFSFVQEFLSPQAASCALMVDIDNDRDLDLALVDELQDVVILMKNSGTTSLGDLNGDGAVNASDLALLLGAWGPCGTVCPADLNGDGLVNASDLALLLGNWG